jgi:hypothetical protein
MADTNSSDAAAIPTDVTDYLENTRVVLSSDEATQFEAVLAPHVADGTLDENQVYEAKLDAEATHDAMERAHESQHEQALAAENGDYAAARDHASDAAWDLRVADEHGGEAAHPTIDAQQYQEGHEIMALDSAAWEQSTAAGYEHDAQANAAVGDYDHAAASADVAAAHVDTATSYADAGDHGGSVATTGAAESAGATTAE